MPKLSHAHETEIRRAIRDSIALDPLFSLKSLLGILEKRFNHAYDHEYIARLLKKVHAEATPNLDRQQVSDRLRKVRETMRLGQENLLKLAYGQANNGGMISARDRIAAWRAVALLEKLQLDAELDLRIYERTSPIGEMDAFRSRAIPAEIREIMLITAKLWRLPTDLTRKIEHREVQAIEPSQSVAPPPQSIARANLDPIKADESSNKPKSTIVSTGILADPELHLS